MEKPQEKIISVNDLPFYDEFVKEFDSFDFEKKMAVFERVEMDYSMRVSSVYSSNIEGNPLDVNSYMRIVNSNDMELKKEKTVLEIDDLKKAYDFAKKNQLNKENFLKAHELLSQYLKIASVEKGNWRIGEGEAIYGDEGLIYVAIETKFVEGIMEDFFNDIDKLLKQNLDIVEVFYYGCLIHLIFLRLHPFRDGNGRAARLLHKWFMAHFLGEIVWKLPFENYYNKYKDEYYYNLDLGINFYETDLSLSKVYDFLVMSVKSLEK